MKKVQIKSLDVKGYLKSNTKHLNFIISIFKMLKNIDETEFKLSIDYELNNYRIFMN